VHTQAPSLSLSLSSIGEESKRRGQGESDLGWVQPPQPTLLGRRAPSHLTQTYPPFTPYQADTYLIDVSQVPLTGIDKVRICPIWCNATSSPAIHLSYWACRRLQATVGLPDSMQRCWVPCHHACHIRVTKILIYFFQPSKRCLEDHPPLPKWQGMHTCSSTTARIDIFREIQNKYIYHLGLIACV
jgi:hypothetical protein